MTQIILTLAFVASSVANRPDVEKEVSLAQGLLEESSEDMTIDSRGSVANRPDLKKAFSLAQETLEESSEVKTTEACGGDEKLEGAISDKESEISDKETEIADLEAEVAEKRSELEALTTQLERKQAQCTQKEEASSVCEPFKFKNKNGATTYCKYEKGHGDLSAAGSQCTRATGKCNKHDIVGMSGRCIQSGKKCAMTLSDRPNVVFIK